MTTKDFQPTTYDLAKATLNTDKFPENVPMETAGLFHSVHVFGVEVSSYKREYHTETHYMQKKLLNLWDLQSHAGYNPRVRIGMLRPTTW